jgi:choline dehydrogenase
MHIMCPAYMAATNTFRLACHLNYEASAGTLQVVSADPAQPPVVDYNYLSEAEDVRRFREGVRLAFDLLQQLPFAEVVDDVISPVTTDVRSTDAALDAWVRSSLGTAYHTSGTCRIGESSDPRAVVDAECRVRGVESLRVIDLSIAPMAIRANTHATALMIGERAADLLKA